MNGQQLLNLAEAGLLLTSDTDEQSKKYLLIVLLDIEDALDKGRSLASDSLDLLVEINKKMDQLRERIRGLINEMDKNLIRDLLVNRGESLKTQFSI